MASIDVSLGLGPGHVVVGLSGELDITDATRFACALSVAAATGSRVIVDLAGLAFMDCSGLSALVSAGEQARRAGGDLALAAPQRPVARLLSLTGLAGPLPVFASVEAAVNGDGELLAFGASSGTGKIGV